MISAGKLAYINDRRSESKTYRPIKHVDPNRTKWKRVAFLWGDPVYVISVSGSVARVSAKGHHLDIPTRDLMPDPILQIFLIDCGQGDAALVQFPDGRWSLVDGGPPRQQRWTNTGKIAFDFLKWKIYRDFSWRKEFNFDPHENRTRTRPQPFHLDSIVITHPDYDHYGGLHELPTKIRETDAFERITVGKFYHCGLGRFSGPYSSLSGGRGMSQLGPVAGSLPDAYVTTLIDGFSDVRKYSRRARGRSYTLAGDYANWVRDLESLEGAGIDEMARLHSQSNGGYVPGFESSRDVALRILGPVEESWNNSPALRYIDTSSERSMKSPSKTRNGLSVVLRADYGDARILLTGDLNFKSQAVLMEHIPTHEYRAHVVKACHHGSEDVSWKFLQATDPVAVMFSSGDQESHAHPRAKVLGWSGAFARKSRGRRRPNKYLNLSEDDYQSPLIYSTELSRSVQLWDPHKVLEDDGAGNLAEVDRPLIQARGRSNPGSEDPRPMNKWLLADRLIYGLINVRTDGQKIAIGVMKESGAGFQVESFEAD